MKNKIKQYIKSTRNKTIEFLSGEDWQIKLCYSFLAVVSMIFLYKFYYVALSRVNYPFDLEWMEGGAVDHVSRILNGEPIYVEPNADFVPYIYTPLSYYLAALLSFVFGKGYVALRVLSILSITGCFVLLYKLTFKETKDRILSFFAPGLFSCTYIISNNWFDVGRVDSLFLFLILAAIYKLRFAQNRKELVWCAILLFLAYFTKQSAILVYPAFILVIASRRWKDALFFSLILIGMTCSTMLVYNISSDGFFWYYTMTLGGEHEFLIDMISGFWVDDLFGRFKLFAFFGVAYFLYLMFKPKRAFNLFYILIGGAMIGLGYFGRLHSGGDLNVMMPTFLMICLCCVFALNDLKQLPLKRIYSVSIIVICSFFLGKQLLTMRYYTKHLIPTMADRQAGEDLMKLIGSVEGPVMVSSHGYYQTLAGKEVNAHFMAAYDILRARASQPRNALINSYKQRIESQYYDLIIQDTHWFVEDILKYYDCVDTLEYQTEKAFFPVTGAQMRPKLVYMPKALNN